MVQGALIDAYLAGRSRLIAAAGPGTLAARELSDLTDEAIAAHAAVASARVGVPFVLFALGGYGAQRLLPGSDLDLLIVSAGTLTELEPIVREVVYPLWNAGLTVGHQVRSPASQLAAVRDDIQNATAFLTARILGGDASLGERVVAGTFGRMHRDARKLTRQLLARKRPGSPYLLEADLKEGAGGQRDLDEIGWHAALLAGTPNAGLGPLVAAGMLTPAEAAGLSAAQATLTAARWVLHRADPRGGNLLTAESAELDGLGACHVQIALERVHHTLLDLRDRLEGASPLPSGDITLSYVRSLALDGDGALPDAERAAYRGRFDAAVPGFSALMTLRRPALSHRYTVGAHSLRAVAAVGSALDALGPERIGAAVRDATIVAALTHDVGKRERGPGHALRGAPTARAAARALGLDAAQAAVAGTLVAEHLLLSDLTAHSDPADEDAVLSPAARLGRRELVAPLYALTEADLRATGPEVWTSWRAALLGDFAARLEDALSPDVDGAGIVAAAEATRAAALRSAASAGASRAVLSFAEHAPLRYLARRAADDVLRDGRLVQSIAGPGAPGRFSFEVRVGPAEGVLLVDIVTRDRPRLFATLSGALALTGIDVLAADVFTAPGGIALDTFTVTSATRAPIDTVAINRLQRTLGLALTGRLDLAVRLAERRRHYPARSGATDARVEIGPRNAFTTRVRVHAGDRVGLLHDLADAIAAYGLDVRRATIVTTGGVASDVFEVTASDGTAPDAEVLRAGLAPRLLTTARGPKDVTSSPAP